MPDPIPVREFTGFNFTRRSCFTATPNGAVYTFHPKLAVMKVFSGSEFPSIPMGFEPKPRISIQAAKLESSRSLEADLAPAPSTPALTQRVFAKRRTRCVVPDRHYRDVGAGPASPVTPLPAPYSGKVCMWSFYSTLSLNPTKHRLLHRSSPASSLGFNERYPTKHRLLHQF